ncbi:hypothetical protein QN277_024281 [Acacia crassicarpa]|uniref:Secreted protein n=1 Tax=Acacia crassicarpa TaxID=499986 RepID=A0AAE1JFF5_9FABA|nr:hypothetical protein QN277_024281 [Acacia crassicarpa]
MSTLARCSLSLVFFLVRCCHQPPSLVFFPVRCHRHRFSPTLSSTVESDKLRLIPEVFGKIRGLFMLDLLSNQLMVDGRLILTDLKIYHI